MNYIQKYDQSCQWTYKGCIQVKVEIGQTKCESLENVNAFTCSQICNKPNNNYQQDIYFIDLNQTNFLCLIELKKIKESKFLNQSQQQIQSHINSFNNQSKFPFNQIIYENNNVGCYYDNITYKCLKLDIDQDEKSKKILDSISCIDFSLGLNKVICSAITTQSTPCRWYKNQCSYLKSKMNIKSVPCQSLEFSNYQACALASFRNEPCQYLQEIRGCINRIAQNSTCDSPGINSIACSQLNCYKLIERLYYNLRRQNALNFNLKLIFLMMNKAQVLKRRPMMNNQQQLIRQYTIRNKNALLLLQVKLSALLQLLKTNYAFGLSL